MLTRFRCAHLLLALVVTGSLAMVSCNKNYTCRCTIKYSGYPGLPDSSIQEFTITNDKSDAKNKCNKESGMFDNNGIHTDEKCVLY